MSSHRRGRQQARDLRPLNKRIILSKCTGNEFHYDNKNLFPTLSPCRYCNSWWYLPVISNFGCTYQSLISPVL